LVFHSETRLTSKIRGFAGQKVAQLDGADATIDECAERSKVQALTPKSTEMPMHFCLGIKANKAIITRKKAQKCGYVFVSCKRGLFGSRDVLTLSGGELY
jgi:hypothetical protein